MSDLSNDTKKQTTKSRETIPLSKTAYIFTGYTGTGMNFGLPVLKVDLSHIKKIPVYNL
jgi:hypothetical protein